MMRKPALLDASLSEVARLNPTSGSVTLKMVGASEANMTMDEDSPAVGIHDWISICTQRGFAGIFRVTNVSQTYKKQIDLTMLHGIDILSDSVWQAQKDFSGTKAEFLRQLLNQQTHLIGGVKPWVLGTCADSAKYEKSINYDRLSNLLEEMVEEGDDYYFTYDQSSFPWVLNYVAKDHAVASEFRLTRNVRTASVTYNDADLCTRLILSVNVRMTDKETGTEYTDTSIRTYNNAQAQAEWGIVVKTADVDTKDDIEAKHFPSADAWADSFLKKRSAPTVQIQIEGDELVGITGDSWDEYAIGRLCQVALPDYGRTFKERVVAVTYPSFLGEPQRVVVSLANTLPKFSENIASIQKAAGSAASSARAASRGAASAKDLTTWSQHVKYYGEALDGTGVMTLYESGIDMDAVGGVKIFSLVEGVQALYAGIKVNAREINMKVSKGDIISEINMSPEEIRISASKINLDGYVTASQLKAELATINKLISGDAVINKLLVRNMEVQGRVTTSALRVVDYDASWKSATVVTDVSISTSSGSSQYVAYITSGGEAVYGTATYLKSASAKCDTMTINYLGR